MSRITGARYIAETMKGYGVTPVFYMEIILPKSLIEMEKLGIRRIVTHSEKAAAYMADGYARMGRRPGACMAQSVGAANLAAGLQDAFLAHSPVLAITGSKPPLYQHRYDEAVDRIIEKYKALEACCDFILCIGSDLAGSAAALEFDFNGDVARNLGSPVLLVASGANLEAPAVVNTARATLDAYQERGAQVLGLVVNRANPDHLHEPRTVLNKELSQEGVMLSVIPAHETLSSPTLKEVTEQLEAEVLYGGDQLDKLAHRYLIIAMQLENYLSHLTPNALLITSGDRNDVILSALQAHQSHRYPQIAGIVLSGGLRPAPTVTQLLDGLPGKVPILSVPTDTYDTASRISNVVSYITADNKAKIDLSRELFEEFVDTQALGAQLSSVQPRGTTFIFPDLNTGNNT